MSLPGGHGCDFEEHLAQLRDVFLVLLVTFQVKALQVFPAVLVPCLGDVVSAEDDKY